MRRQAHQYPARRLALLMLSMMVLAASCVKDDLWRECHSKTYAVGDHITVAADSIATVASSLGSRADSETALVPMPGYLTVIRSHYYSNAHGDTIYKERVGTEAMHNVRVNVTVVEGTPHDILSLTCTIGGLASRFDVAHGLLLGPSARVTDGVTMHGNGGTALFRLLGAAANRQPLTLHLTQTDGRQLQVEVDVTPVLHDLRPTPFELSLKGGATTDVHTETEATVNINLELRLPPPSDTEATLTATLTGWQTNEEDVNAY